ncbi:MAG: hypothetical protein KIS74_10735, partial [Burkholderiales bacterium]|nr:hypothetical protein [Burkholderiales bacterium]
FYDSIEVARDRAIAKYRAREARWNAFAAFVATFVEALLALAGIRAIYRLLKKAYARLAGRFGRGPRAPEPVAGD